MRAGEASTTARRVAAHRLGFERWPAPYGDPGADERLARDVAGSTTVSPRGLMVEYLAARTRFFDRVVVEALDRGCPQVVIAAAGYDGRALRYAKPGVGWFELDHPDTQTDKIERLERLGIGTSHAAFVAADFETDPVAAALEAAGHDAGRPSVFLCEGVAVYLAEPVLRRLLVELRHAAAAHSRLAISVSVESGSPTTAARRALFRVAVAAVGEPARTVLAPDEATALMASTGWRLLPPSADGDPERARRAGLLLAEPA